MPTKALLRPATPEDVEVLAELWVSTFPDKFGPILGQNAQAVLVDWLRLSQRHVQTTTIIEAEGQVAGYMMLDTPSAPRPDSGRWLWHALQLHHGIIGALRGFSLMVLVHQGHTPAADEIYIEMVGVAPAFRGRGLARQLLGYAEFIATQEGVSRLCLSVVDGNRAAINLYQKLGFEITGQQKSRLLQWLTGYHGYYEMTKSIA